MSGIPGMGQRWQAALKIRVIMIPLPENTAAGVASGVCRSMEGSCGASGSLAGRSLHIPSHTGGEKIINPRQGIMLCLGVWGLLFVEEGFQIQRKRLHFWEKGRTHTYFVIPDCRGIRHHGRKTPDKRAYRTGQKIFCQMRYGIGLVLLI